MSATDPTAPDSPARKRSVVRSLLRLWPYVRPVRARFFTAAGVAVVASCLSLVLPMILRWIVDGPVAERDLTGVWIGGLVLLGVGVLEAALFGLRRWLVARPLAGVEASMRTALYRHTQRLPVAFHDRWSSGQLLSRATGDLQELRMFLAFPLTFLVVNVSTIIVGCAIMLSLSWQLALIVMSPFLPLMWVCISFEKQYSVAARRAQDQMGDLTTVTEESVLGIRVIKGFGRHRSQARAFRALSDQLYGTEVVKARMLGWILAVIIALPELVLGVVLVVGVLQVASGALSVGTLVAFTAIALALRWPVESIGFILAMCNEAATASDRFFEVLDTEPPRESAGAAASAAVPRTPVPGPAADAGEPADGAGEADGMRLTGVGFRYPDASPDAEPVLHGIDLHVRAGETMALVGATGSGKTTLTALLPRLHEATEGTIALDGRDIAEMSRAEVRALVAVAFEEPTLFSASVRENVLMGAVDGTADEEEFRRALRVAQATGFVDALPLGADTEVGEQGMSLSGGQRQRLALARAVVGRPRFLVLDDPLSALDVHTEARVEAALREVLVGTTALVVAHRPSTVMLADRVALLSGGGIAAVGTHAELMRTSAEYRHLMSGEERDPGTGPEREEVSVR
ncbi:ABC transporter ATP-binding protein [Streptomyces bohaiensis]|uniref:ABC transporter ATP-binding protein n=1 Tax=Streptomyces bohaiensis TaxID=1431344 RepID=A0ABX1CJV0_9ACTN|nr:ABC transporter ATP-binding protein [Streptomyces bohaiensis]NJQ17559.1 ABC transporter ATP-binding protein [Streptomyces bohaiensis]